MKRFHSLVIATFLFLFSYSVAAQNNKKDEAAIKKVLQQETSTYFHKDYNGWSSCWLHDTAASVVRAGANGYEQLSGWNAIATEYKSDIESLRTRSDEEIAPFLNKTGYNIYINGNVATVSFKEGDKATNTEMRTLVKQDGEWKILNFTMIREASYTMQNIMNTMNGLVGKWELDGKATMEPSNGAELKSVTFEVKKTSDGWEQLSTFRGNYQGHAYTSPVSYEHFIPNYNNNTIFYAVIEKIRSGQTFPGTGSISSDKPNSFTVTQMFPDKPTAVRSEYTVTLENDEWHQTSKTYDRNGKQIRSSSINLHRVVE
jgi:hypothetical protein